MLVASRWYVSAPKRLLTVEVNKRVASLMVIKHLFEPEIGFKEMLEASKIWLQSTFTKR